jgi:hypothetical protein
MAPGQKSASIQVVVLQEIFFTYAAARSLKLIRWGSLTSIRKHQDDDPYNHRDGTIDRPLDLAGHKAAGENIDALQEPGASGKDEQNTEYA